MVTLRKFVWTANQLAELKWDKSTYTAKNLTAGTVLTEEYLSYKTPGGGIAPNQLDQVLGRTLICDIQEDELIKLDMLS